jgi:hypothetical protein
VLLLGLAQLSEIRESPMEVSVLGLVTVSFVYWCRWRRYWRAVGCRSLDKAEKQATDAGELWRGLEQLQLQRWWMSLEPHEFVSDMFSWSVPNL